MTVSSITEIFGRIFTASWQEHHTICRAHGSRLAWGALWCSAEGLKFHVVLGIVRKSRSVSLPWNI